MWTLVVHGQGQRMMFTGKLITRDGYQTYYSNVRLTKPVGEYPEGYKFMEAIVNDSNQTVKFANYGTFDTEYSTTVSF